jgi:hypothetical protein
MELYTADDEEDADDPLLVRVAAVAVFFFFFLDGVPMAFSDLEGSSRDCSIIR